MKTIKIFLASSEELQTEREKMADLVLHLNKLFKGRGLELDLEKWEYLDASMSGKRKQDEYNDVLHQCDICMVLFWRRFGSYTGEELDVAYKSHLAGGNPQKIYVFFKNPNGDDISQEVRDFIAEYEQRFGGHFFCKYQSVDTMKLEFLLQLENYQKELIGEKAIEVRNEHVYVDNEALVDLNNIPFAAANEGFQKMQAELAELRKEIDELRSKMNKKEAKMEKRKSELEENPDDEDCLDEYNDAKEEYEEVVSKLQKKLDRKNKLEEDFEREQQNLFNTARRMSALRSQRITERMARAIDAFEEGDAHRANIILDEAERDADQALADIRQAKKVGMLSIDELLLKTSTIMSDTTMPIEERIEQTYQLYQKAVTLAKEVDYDKGKYGDLLEKYGGFLSIYAKYDEALAIHSELAKLREEMLGKDHSDTAASYINIGIVYYHLGNYDKALEYYKQALDFRERVLGKGHSDTATSYNNIGVVYSDLGDYDKALEYHMQALDIRERVLGKDHPDTARSYNNIGLVYSDLGDYVKVLEYYMQALDILERVLGKDHPDTARSYNNIGNVYADLGDYDKALDYYKKALDIRERVLGKDHPDTAASYNNIGLVYSDLGDYVKALEYYKQALDIQERVLGKDHHGTATSYNNIGLAYYNLGDYDKALEYSKQALDIQERVLGKDHPGTSGSYNNIAWTYHLWGKYEEALPWAEKAIASSPNKPEIIDTLATVYQDLGRYDEALEQFELCLELKKEQGANEDSIRETEDKIEEVKKLMK